MEKEITPAQEGAGDSQEKKGGNRTKLFLAIAFLIIAMVYDVSPIDLIPDIIPIAGFGDDIIITVLSIWNLIKQLRKNN